MIQTWELDFSTRGVTFGASYTDVHASLPVLHFLAIVSLIAAALFLVNIRYRGWRLPAIAIAVMFLTWAFAGKAYPAIIQQYRVSPNEITAESEYIANNIEATRWAFGLDGISQGLARSQHRSDAGRRHRQLGHDRQRAPVGAQAGAVDVLPDPGDPPLLLVQRRRRRPLRHRRQVPPGADQRPRARPDPAPGAIADLGEQAPHLHARLRLRAEPGERSRRRGPPAALGQQHPADHESPTSRSPGPRSTTERLGNEFVVVKTDEPRSSTIPRVTTNVFVDRLRGRGRRPIGSTVRRVAFAFRFNSLKLLVSSSSPMNRGSCSAAPSRSGCRPSPRSWPTTRTPTSCVRDDGSLVWMWDAYTTTDRFPYSQPQATGSTTSGTPSRWSSTPITAESPSIRSTATTR